MKKLFYTILLLISISVSFTACTEEDVTPTEIRNGGGGISDPK